MGPMNEVDLTAVDLHRKPGGAGGPADMQADVEALLAAPLLLNQWGIVWPVTRFAADELWLLALVAVAGPITALWPAWRASQRALADGLTPRL